MADENKIQLDVELSKSSIDTSFEAIDTRAEKSAKTSAAVFGEYFQRQETELKASIESLVGSTKKVAEKSAKESADAFATAFKKQDDIYKASVKQNLDNAIKAITEGSGSKKSAQESASVFEEQFAREAKSFKPVEIPVEAKTNPLAVKGLADLAGGFYLAKQAADLLASSAKAAIDQIIEGEQKIRLEKRFEALALQAGVAADVISNDLSKAAKGLIDDDRLLELASESFVKLGNNAKALPQILELARKTYKVFGGDVVANTEAISQAIFTGQTRQLKGLGILIDTEKVYKEYAKSIGTVVPLLTEQQKQTSLLNAVLEQGNTRFKSIKEGADGATEAAQRSTVSFKQLNDELAKAASRNFGGIFTSIASSVTSAVDSVTQGMKRARPAETVDEIVTKMEVLRGKVTSYEKQLSDLGASGGLAIGASLKAGIKVAEEQLAEYSDKLDKAQMNQASKLSEAAAGVGAAGGGSAAPTEEFLRRRQELIAKVQDLNNQLNQSEIALAQQEFQRRQTSASFEKVVYEQRKAEAEKFEQDMAALKKFYADNGVIDIQLRQQGEQALESAHVNRLLQIDQAAEEQRKMLFNQTTTEVLSVGSAFQSVAEGMQLQSQELAVNAGKNFKNLGRTMLTTIGGAAGQAFGAFGAAIRTGEDALEAFGKSLLNSLGQAAIQMGSTFILQGIAYTYAGLANGPPLIAAGAALAAAGGFLAASGGSGPSTSSGGGSAGSGGGLDANPITSTTSIEETQASIPKTDINITVQGNILDRRESGLAIAQILEEQFAEQGLQIRGVG